ncbi:MAG: hypothetical protein C0402_05195 [Thermodesulfovibrio sp.]|nr:hypothetical protein [Thermodesulfovibrio sp.]
MLSSTSHPSPFSSGTGFFCSTLTLFQEAFMRLVLFLLLSVCFVAPAFSEETVIKERQYSVQLCSSPTASVIVGSVVCKANACRTDRDLTPQSGLLQRILSLSGQPQVTGISDGMGDMLLTTLKKTGCVDLLEREGLEQLRQEMELAGIAFKPPTADYMIMGSVNSIKVESSDTNIGGGYIPVIGSLDIKKTNITLAFDIRLVQVSTGKILFTNTYEGSNKKSGFGIGGATSFGNVAFGGAYSSLKGTPVEEVARDIIIRVTADLISQIQKDKSAALTVPSQPQVISGPDTKPVAIINQNAPADSTAIGTTTALQKGDSK